MIFSVNGVWVWCVLKLESNIPDCMHETVETILLRNSVSLRESETTLCCYDLRDRRLKGYCAIHSLFGNFWNVSEQLDLRRLMSLNCWLK